MASVNVQFKGDMLFEAKSGNQTLRTDVPAAMGGKERGMTPTELLATSLASCVSVLVVAYCRDMKIDATGMSVDLTYDKLDQPTRLGHFKVAIKFPAGGWESRKEGILRAAERCPVHETIRHHHEETEFTVS
ncbi:MAG: OsmC family protein [Candidatus Brocadiia bacterium]|jgi:putative redox protein